MRKLSDIKIKNRLNIGFGIILFFSLALGVISLYELNKMAGRTERLYSHPYRTSNSALEIKFHFTAIHRSMKDVVLSNDEREMNECKNIIHSHERAVDTLLTNLQNSFLGDKAKIENLLVLFGKWKKATEELYEMKIAGLLSESIEFTMQGEVKDIIDQTNKEADEIYELAKNKAEELKTISRDAVSQDMQILFISIAFILVASLIVSYRITRSIIVPVSRIVQNTQNTLRSVLGKEINFTNKNAFTVLEHAVDELRNTGMLLNQEVKVRIKAEQEIKLNQEKIIIQNQMIQNQNEELELVNGELIDTNRELIELKTNLEQKVIQRAEELEMAYKEIKASEKRLQTVINSIPNPIFYTSADGQYLFCNNSWLAFWDCHQDQFLNKTIGEISVSNYWNEYSQSIGQSVSNFNEGRQEIKIKNFTGVQHEIIEIITKVEIEKGEIEGWVGIWIDISDLIHSKEALRANERLLRYVLGSLPVGIWIADSNLKIMEVNQAGKKIWEYKIEEVPSNLLEQSAFLSDEPEKEYLEELPILRLIKNKTAILNEEMKIECFDSSIKSILYSAIPIPGENDEISGIVIVNEDITKIKIVEANLKKALSEKEVLIREIHHRVKNNMQAINSIINLSTEKFRHVVPAEVFRDVENRISSMSLIHELLYQKTNLAKIDLNDYILRLSNGLSNSYGLEQNVTFEIKVTDVFLSIETAIPCGLMINELISNSLKYAFPKSAKGKIQVLMKKQEKFYNLVVLDNGVGLPESFDINNTKTLGMTLIKGWVRQLQGTLKIINEKGAEFNITFKQIDKES